MDIASIQIYPDDPNIYLPSINPLNSIIQNCTPTKKHSVESRGKGKMLSCIRMIAKYEACVVY